MAVNQVAEASPQDIVAAKADAPATAEDARAANVKEYSQFVAAEPIFFGAALGYNKGDQIPADNVRRHKYLESGQVVKVGSKAHQELRASLGLPPLES